MAAAYDHYDYPQYWETREYEHKAEVIALKALIQKISKIKTIIEIGAGYGRLTPVYINRTKRTILTDPSAKLLGTARKTYKSKNVQFIQSRAELLPKRVRKNTADVVICIRVLHHIDDIDKFIVTVRHLLKRDGYLILEFANKRHFKAVSKEFLKGNFIFPLDIFPKDARSKKSIKNQTITFNNYHPHTIKRALTENGFDIIEKRSVSNVRSTLLKRVYPVEFLLFLEKNLQKLFGKTSLGPSIFLLAQKKN